MPAASEFADYHDAVGFQNSRLFGHQPPSDSWGAMAQRFRLDPRRDLDANLQDGFRPRWKRSLREVLITWETT